MFFKSKKAKNTEKAVQSQRNIKNMTDEITKIWSGENKHEHTDVGGSYTGNPVGYSSPEQDGDDL